MTKPIRCAIYTRKSSEEGLDQVYNSLDAQRDACSAYVLSQAGEGWVVAPGRYDDGGFSGGNLERPALKALIADVEAGKVDVVVVYKIDRLTRSLIDFSKIVEVFDRKGASFVSVTQAFNTTTSMGRLTLNVLLSFAQFEREVTGERIRDKITQSKKLGMWMGGNVPLGYRPNGRTLEIEADEAATVRMIFRRYLELKSVHRLQSELDAKGVTSKCWTSKAGKTFGGVPIGRGPLFHILRNRTYLGEIPHKDTSYAGLHAAIIDRETFDRAQALMNDASAVRKVDAEPSGERGSAMFTGLICDGEGRPMSPVWSKKPGRPAYRYYVTRGREQGGRPGAVPRRRICAPMLEEFCLDRLRAIPLLSPIATRAEIRASIKRVIVKQGEVVLELDPALVERAGGAGLVERQLQPEERLEESETGCKLRLPLTLERRGIKTIAYGPKGSSAINRLQIDPALSAALVKAEAWKRRLLMGEVETLAKLAAEEGVAPTYAARVIRTAFLAPGLKAAILSGSQPAKLTLQAILTNDVPVSWADQQTLYRS